MSTIRKKGDKQKYNFSSCDCLGRKCFAPGMFLHYNGTSVINETFECMNRAYHGCDLENNPFLKELALSRKKEGWKCSY